MTIQADRIGQLIVATDNEVPGLSFILNSQSLKVPEFLARLTFLLDNIKKHPECLALLKKVLANGQLTVVELQSPQKYLRRRIINLIAQK